MRSSVCVLAALVFITTACAGQGAQPAQILLESRYPILDPSFIQVPFYGQSQMVYVVTDSVSVSICTRAIDPITRAWTSQSTVVTGPGRKRHPVGALTTNSLPVIFWEEEQQGKASIQYSIFQGGGWILPKTLLSSDFSQTDPVVGQVFFYNGPIVLAWIEDDSIATAYWTPDSVYSVEKWKKNPAAHVSNPVISIDYGSKFCAWQEDADSSELIQCKNFDDTSSIQTFTFGGVNVNRNPGTIRSAGTVAWSATSGQAVNIVAVTYMPWNSTPDQFSFEPITSETTGDCDFGGGMLYPVVTAVSQMHKTADYTRYHFLAWRWEVADSSAIVLFFPPLYPPTRKEFWSKDSVSLPIVSFPMLSADSMSFWTVWVESDREQWIMKGALTSFFYRGGGVEPFQPNVAVLLSQNYPNPFNPSTTIRFRVMTRSRVRLAVFNLLGQQMAELANEDMIAGDYERSWNANVASGMYFYRIEAVSASDPGKPFVDVKKMMLLK